MSAMPRRAAGVAMAGAILAIVAGGSQWPWKAAPDDIAIIRLDWRARAERVEECRPPTEEEIAERPPHMRPLEICEGRVSPYALRVVVDGEVIVDDTIHGAGAREDRPLYVAREIGMLPGLHELRIEFEKIETGETDREAGEEEEPDDGVEYQDDEADADGEDDEDHEKGVVAAESTPSVRLEGTFRLAPREVLVVTYDPERRQLAASAPPVDR